MRVSSESRRQRHVPRRTLLRPVEATQSHEDAIYATSNKWRDLPGAKAARHELAASIGRSSRSR